MHCTDYSAIMTCSSMRHSKEVSSTSQGKLSSYHRKKAQLETVNDLCKQEWTQDGEQHDTSAPIVTLSDLMRVNNGSREVLNDLSHESDAQLGNMPKGISTVSLCTCMSQRGWIETHEYDPEQGVMPIHWLLWCVHLYNLVNLSFSCSPLSPFHPVFK